MAKTEVHVGNDPGPVTSQAVLVVTEVDNQATFMIMGDPGGARDMLDSMIAIVLRELDQDPSRFKMMKEKEHGHGTAAHRRRKP